MRLHTNMWCKSLEALGPEPAKISYEEYLARQQRLFSQLRPNDLLIITAPHESTRSKIHYHIAPVVTCYTFVDGKILKQYSLHTMMKGTGSHVYLFNQRTCKKYGKVVTRCRRRSQGWPIDNAVSHEDLQNPCQKCWSSVLIQ